ncbi:MAG TPA: DUF3859 domain-containing protein [Blastocatellia bacterium]|nr:DUF3859 domain-containing protein [Blastocatellia bacterium]
MKSQLSEKQWNQVVAEVTRLAQEREDEQSRREITAQVLAELQLPTDLIDDALKQVQYREALAQQRRQRIWLSVAGATLLLVIIVSLWTWSASRSASFARITADNSRITRTTDSGEHLSSVPADGQDTVFHVTLRDVPLGEKLDLSCNWIDPTGTIFHQSRYETRTTDKAVWPTQCRCRIGTAAPKGNWKVEMKLGDRMVAATDFKVE